MPVANCPSCGGPINFAIGSSVVVVCDYCHSIVARTDVALQDLGKVAALVDTGSPLRRDLTGKYHGVGFRITGRTQMRHEMGGVWDEWYAAFDDGRWGWLAEAMGKFYLTFTAQAQGLPPFNVIQVGGHLGPLVVQEVGTATLVSGEGEIPWRVEPGSTYEYADLAGPNHQFATIDYSEETPLLFRGEETDLKGLGIDAAHETPRATKIKAEKLSCSNCGAALNLVAPDQAERIICPSCGAVHDVAEGDLRYLHVIKLREKPRIPLGSKGKIGDDDFVIAGWMRRFVTEDGVNYPWEEYLLYNQAKGFHWLVDSDDHWSFAHPISPGDVQDGGSADGDAARRINFDGQTYRIFADDVATVETVVGEFYWKVEAGEKARAVDYINPPLGISKEISGKGTEREIAYTAARYMPVDEVEKAFGIKGLPRPSGVGMLQPYVGGGAFKLWSWSVIALFVVAIIVAIHNHKHEVLSQLFDFGAAPPPPTATDTTGTSATTATDTTGTTATDTTATDTTGTTATDTTATTSTSSSNAKEMSRVIFVPPFKIAGGRNLEVEGYTDVDNNWVYVGGDIANEQTGLVDSFDLPLEYYHGVDDGESWTEGDKKHVVHLAALPGGDYTMRLEAQWPEGQTPPRVMIVIREGVFRWSYFFITFALITVAAFFLGMRRGVFENQRWADAGFTQMGVEKD